MVDRRYTGEIWTDRSKIVTRLLRYRIVSVQRGQNNGDNVVKRLCVPVGFRHDLKPAQGIEKIAGQRPGIMAARNAALVLTVGDQTVEKLFHAVQVPGHCCVDARIMGCQFDRAVDGQAATTVALAARTFDNATELEFNQAPGASA